MDPTEVVAEIAIGLPSPLMCQTPAEIKQTKSKPESGIQPLLASDFLHVTFAIEIIKLNFGLTQRALMKGGIRQF